MFTRTLHLIVGLALLSFSACQKDTSEKATVETVDGVEYVHNPAEPLQPEARVTFVEELVLGAEDESEEPMLYQPGPFAVDARGRIFVADRSDQVIKVFDADGRYLHAIGAKGRGPGEFLQIVDLAFLPDGRLLVMDMGNRRTSQFTPEGEHLESCTWPGFLFRVLMSTDSSFTTEEMTMAPASREKWVKSLDFSCKEARSYGPFRPPEVSVKKQGKMAVAIGQPHAPSSIFAGDGQRQWLYHCFNNAYVIEVYDETGRLFRKIDRPYEPVPFTEKDKQAFLARFEKGDNPLFAQLAKEMEFPEVKTVAAELLVDDAGRLWVRTNETRDEKGGQATAYDVFDPDGYYLARVWSSVHPWLFSRGKMYSRVTDEETELPTIRRYRVEWQDAGS